MKLRAAALKMSAREYVPALLSYWWLVGIAGMGTLGRFIQVFYWDKPMPDWFWWAAIVGPVLIAQFLAFHKMRVERDRLRKFGVTQDGLRELAAHRSKLISMQNEPIADEVGLGQWIERYQSQRLLISGSIKQNISPAEAGLFDDMGTLPLELLGDEQGVKATIGYIRKRSMVIRDHRHLFELVKDYARKNAARIIEQADRESEEGEMATGGQQVSTGTL